MFKAGVPFPHGEVAYSGLSKSEQRAYHSRKNRASYLAKVGAYKRCIPSENTPERIAQKARDKANLRATRAKQARFHDELTQLVVSEAHALRKQRNTATGVAWHVDHIIPLKGKNVCGLHIWSNLAVILKHVNLSKGNKIAFSD